MRKLFLLLIVLFALFVFLNATAGVAAGRDPSGVPQRQAEVEPPKH